MIHVMTFVRYYDSFVCFRRIFLAGIGIGGGFLMVALSPLSVSSCIRNSVISFYNSQHTIDFIRLLLYPLYEVLP